MSADLGDPTQSQLLRLVLAHHHYRAATIADLRGATGRDRAFLSKGRTQLAQGFNRRVGTNTLVGGEFDGVALALRQDHRNDFSIKKASGNRCSGTLVRAGRKFILLFTGQVITLVVVFCGNTHPQLIKRAKQAVISHGVLHLPVPVLHTLARSAQVVRSIGHGFHATSNDDVKFTRTNELVSKGDGVNATEAHLVQGERGNAHG